MNDRLIVLVHSPLVGPTTWRRVAESLRERGHETVVPSLSGALDEGLPYHSRLATRAAAAIPSRPVARSLVLVAHSGGGVLLPAIAAAASAQVFASIYVDALLPNPGRSWLDSAPAPLAGRLVNLAVDGRLPSWDRWFPQGTIECLLPDPTARTAFLGDLPEVPLACLSEPAPAVPDPALNRGYIRLSDPYDGAAEAAMRLGWVIHREALHHLAMLTDPLPVADAILSVLARMEARNADGS